jgi:hypothetical protein
MNTGNYSPTRILARGGSNRVPPIAQRSTLASVRAMENIRLWQSYLPDNCVNTMVKMRWDQTT